MEPSFVCCSAVGYASLDYLTTTCTLKEACLVQRDYEVGGGLQARGSGAAWQPAPMLCSTRRVSHMGLSLIHI